MAPIPGALVSSFDRFSASLANIHVRRGLDYALASIKGRDLPLVSLDGLSSCFSSIGLTTRDVSTSLFKRYFDEGNLSSHAIHSLARRTDPSPAPDAARGRGTADPKDINNKGMLGLFALLFAALVVLSIWFFFFAKNGGFVFKEGDWDEYKSTVLRRKGVDGKTLSNATKSTDLGQTSVNGEFDEQERVNEPTGRDQDVRQYRHEKPARVGGLNRKADGSYWDHSNTDRSEIMTEKAPPTERTKKNWFHRVKKQEARQPTPRQASNAYSFTTGDDSTVISDESYVERPRAHQQRSSRPQRPREYREHREHRDYREHRESRHGSRNPSRHASPSRRSQGNTYRHSGYGSDRGHGSERGYGSEREYMIEEESDLGTKSYRHVIPGYSQGTRTDDGMSGRY